MPTTRSTLVLLVAILALSAPSFARFYTNPYARRGGNNNTNQPQTPAPPDYTELNQAQSDLIAAQKKLDDANATLNKAVAPLQKAFESSPDYVQATAALAAATIAYQNARADLIASLASNADYQADLAAKKSAEQKVDAAREAGADDQLTAAAQDALNAGSAAAKIQADAEASDADLTKAHQAVLDAAAKVTAMKTQFAASIRSDPTFTAASQAVTDAQTALTDAQKKVADAKQNLIAPKRPAKDTTPNPVPNPQDQ